MLSTARHTKNKHAPSLLKQTLTQNTAAFLIFSPSPNYMQQNIVQNTPGESRLTHVLTWHGKVCNYQNSKLLWLTKIHMATPTFSFKCGYQCKYSESIFSIVSIQPQWKEMRGYNLISLQHKGKKSLMAL